MIDQISTLLREVASTVIMPRFQKLGLGDVEEKSPGDLVTIADREAETAIARGLASFAPECRIIGEEAAASDPSLMNGIDDGRIWLVDPLDGTANFASGKPPFAVMVALLSQGETAAAWMFDPVNDRLAVAERGSGAWLNSARIATSSDSEGPEALRGAVFTKFMPLDVRDAIVPRHPAIGEVLPGLMCCGAEYPDIATGVEDFALFWRTLPWDHAPGALFLTEAGGKVARPDGTEYRPGSGAAGLLAARCEEVWADVQAALLA